MSQVLKRIADQLNVAVLVVNQIDFIEGLGSSHKSCLHEYGEQNLKLGTDYVAITSALGPTWQHCPSTRIILEHERDPHREETSVDDLVNEDNHYSQDHAWRNARGYVRMASVVKSNVTRQSSMKYEVTSSGLSQL